MDHLSADQLAQLSEALQGERATLLAQHSVQESEAKADKSNVETQDAAMLEQLRTNAVLTADRSRARLADLDAALERIRDHEYGICEETDEPIPFRRLLAEPTARYTVEGLESIEADEKAQRDAAHNPGAY